MAAARGGVRLRWTSFISSWCHLSTYWIQFQRNKLLVPIDIAAAHLTNWLGSSAETISLIVVGGVLLLAACVNELYTKRSPIIPPRLFKVVLSDLEHSYANPVRREQRQLYLSPTFFMLWLFTQVRVDKVSPVGHETAVFRCLLSSVLLSSSRSFCYHGGCTVSIP